MHCTLSITQFPGSAQLMPWLLYLHVSPDFMINNLHKYYIGFAIEFKSPKGNGALLHDQSKMLQHYQYNGFKTLISNDYDYIFEQLIEYFRDVRIKCLHCSRKFISSQSIKKNIKSFHKGLKEKNLWYSIVIWMNIMLIEL